MVAQLIIVQANTTLLLTLAALHNLLLLECISVMLLFVLSVLINVL